MKAAMDGAGKLKFDAWAFKAFSEDGQPGCALGRPKGFEKKIP
jgi:hypothetical protein